MGRVYIDVAKTIGGSRAVEAQHSRMLLESVLEELEMPECFSIHLDFKRIDSYSVDFIVNSLGALSIFHSLEELRKRLFFSGLGDEGDEQMVWHIIERTATICHSASLRALREAGLCRIIFAHNVKLM